VNLDLKQRAGDVDLDLECEREVALLLVGDMVVGVFY
jgi:hypothetical protein